MLCNVGGILLDIGSLILAKLNELYIITRSIVYYAPQYFVDI